MPSGPYSKINRPITSKDHLVLADTAGAQRTVPPQRLGQWMTENGYGGGSSNPVYVASIDVLKATQDIKGFYETVSVDHGDGSATALFSAPVAATVKKVSVSYLSNDSSGASYDEIQLDFGTLDTSNGQVSEDGFSVSWSPESNTGFTTSGSSLASVSQGDVFSVGFLSGNSTALTNTAYKGLVITVFFEDA